MKITTVKVYLVEPQGSDYGHDADHNPNAPHMATGAPALAHPLSIFDEYKYGAPYMGPYAYKPFVVEIETDTGDSGFAVNHGGGAAAARVVSSWFTRFLVGQDPFDTNRIWEMMRRSQLSTDQGGIAYAAMSAVDLALWDLKGKVVGKPVYSLIGGKTKDVIPAYVTTFKGVMHHVADKGFKAMKLSCPWGPTDGLAGLRKVEELVAEARDLVGPDTPLMVECYMGWDSDFVVRAARRLEKYDVDWIEDPLLGDATNAQYRDVKDAIKPLRLALGNEMWGDNRFAALLSERCVDVVQPEIQWAGGLTSALRIAAMARGQGVPIIAHFAGIYSYHFTMAHIESPMAEYLMFGDGTAVRGRGHEIVGEPGPIDGYITLTDDPGFGIGLNHDVLIPFEGGVA